MIQLETATSRESRSFERRARIGRHRDNSLVLASPTVSSTHAQIEWRQNGYYLRDLGSVNGTFVVGIWGRRVASEQATSTLAKLIHDTRTMFIKAGIEGLFIEKKRGRTRRRLGPDQVELVR